jgi:LacI family transcriptional regulator
MNSNPMLVKKRPTQSDVAKLAGVSQSMVSYILNENTNLKISKETRQRVFEAMTRLGYVPNNLARSLRSGQTQTVGLVVPDNSNPFFAEIARQIEDLVFERGFSLILCNTDGDAHKESTYVDVLLTKQVDGVILISANGSTASLEHLQQSGIPYVLTDRNIEGVHADLVLVDNLVGGYLATRYLVELGMRRIACISGPVRTSSGDRVKGYEKALAEAGIDLDPSLIVASTYTIEGGIASMNSLLDSGPAPDGLFACNDMIALGAMRAAREHGLRVPQDLSVVGFDDIVLAHAIEPQLTTISQPISEIVREVTRLLFVRIEQKMETVKEIEAQRIVLQPQLIVRNSTRAVPA